MGAAATLLYALLAAGLGALGLGASAASVLAYAAAAVLAYLGHKRITFRSGAAHAAEIPRFAAASALGLAISAAAPVVLADWWRLPRLAPILATCAGVPLLNFLVLERLVFARRQGATPEGGDRPCGDDAPGRLAPPRRFSG